jgi:BirA family biotin operon repressor/biotin-[acetyl-CoA-carboxylase] ligase
MNYLRNELLHILADGEFHSGTELGEHFAISRAAIGKHINALQDIGIDIYSVKGKGYRIAKPLSLLDSKKIDVLFHQLTGQTSANCTVLPVVDSTNTYLKDRIVHLHTGNACVAETQTSGRGRHGRQWYSPFASNIYLSLYWCFSGGYQTIAGLSLVVGIAVADVLDDLGIQHVGLKWPNDVYINMAKVAGILVEVEGTVADEVHTIIGVGLNVDLAENLDLGQDYTSAQHHVKNPIERNELVAHLLTKLHHYLTVFANKGLSPFQERWERLNAFNHKPVKLLLGKESVMGICMGINDQGALLVQVDGVIKAYHGGEISVRAVD